MSAEPANDELLKAITALHQEVAEFRHWSEEAVETALGGLHAQTDELRSWIEQAVSRADNVNENWQVHLADSLQAIRVLAAHQRRQQLIGQATVAIGRTLLVPAEEDAKTMAEIIERLERDLGVDPQEEASSS